MDLTAKSSPDGMAVASETVAVEPRPMVEPLIHSINWIDTLQKEERKINMEV